MHHKVGYVLKIPIGGKQRQPVFQCVRGYPVVWVWQLHAASQELRTQAPINCSRIGAGMLYLKRVQELSRLLKRRR